MHLSVANRIGPLFVISMVAVTLMGPLSLHAFIPALPMVQREFAIDAATTQFILSVTLFTMAAATLFYGPLSDRFGRRPVLLFGLALFLIGTLGCAFAGNVPALIGGRFVQAGGAACGLVLARAMVRDVYGDDKLVKMLAYLTMAYVLGPMIAPLVGGMLADSLGWRAIFYMGLCIGVPVIILTALVIHETAPNIDSGSGERIVLQDYAKLFRTPRFTGYVLHCGFISASFFAFVSAASYLMSEVLHRPATEYSRWFIAVAGAYLIGNFAASRLSGLLSINTAIIIGTLFSFATAIGFVVWVTIEPIYPLMLFLPCTIASFGQGLSMPNAQSGAMRVDAKLTGTASGLIMFAHLFLGASGAQIIGFIADGTALSIALTYLGLVTLSLIAALIAVRPLKPTIPTNS